MKLIKLYRKSQEAQLAWIKKHPWQYVILNVTLTAMWIGYIEWKDRKEQREFEAQYAAEHNE